MAAGVFLRLKNQTISLCLAELLWLRQHLHPGIGRENSGIFLLLVVSEDQSVHQQIQNIFLVWLEAAVVVRLQGSLILDINVK